MTNDTETPPVRNRRWLAPALFVSLAANLLVAGVVVGAVIAGGPDRGGRPDGPARSLLGEPFVRALESKDRRELGREMMSNRDKLRENRSDIRKRMESLLAALRDEEFDRDALSGLLSEQRGLAIARQELGEELLLNRLEAMSVDERRAYADRLGESFKRFRQK